MKEIFNQLGLCEINPGAFCGWQWVANTNKQQLLNSFNPANEQLIAQVGVIEPREYEKIIEASLVAAREWARVPAPKRGEIIRQIGDVLRQKKDALGTLVTLEMGKIKQEGDGEVQEMIDIADFAVGQSRMLYGKTMHSERAEHRMYEQWHPLGIVGIISAFNFPVAVWAWNAFLAAIAGNVCIWKPSPHTPLTAVAVQNICNEVLKANDCPAIFSLMITEDVALAQQFVADPRVALVSFTGSTAVGRQVATTVANRMGKTLLELGGNNALIVDESANLSLAVPAIVFGAVGTAGQRCTTTRRVIVHEKIYPTLVARLVEAYKQVKIGDPLKPQVLMGPLINPQAVSNYKNAIERIKQLGGEILCGGNVLPGKGLFVEPTLIKAENHWDIVQQETFAPITYVMTFKTLEEAISLQNAVPQGLSSAIFTEDLLRAETFLSSRGSDCGIANVNIGTSGAEIGGAFGGEKDTGGGREAGSDSWQAYMRRQTNTINWGKTLPLAQGIRFDLGD